MVNIRVVHLKNVLNERRFFVSVNLVFLQYYTMSLLSPEIMVGNGRIRILTRCLCSLYCDTTSLIFESAMISQTKSCSWRWLRDYKFFLIIYSSNCKVYAEEFPPPYLFIQSTRRTSRYSATKYKNIFKNNEDNKRKKMHLKGQPSGN